MKKSSIFIVAILAIALVLGGYSAVNSATTDVGPKAISGVWTNPENPTWYVVISQDKQDMVMTCNFWGGPNKDIPVIFHGVGKAVAGKLTYDVTFTVCPAGWETKVKHELDVRENGNALVGFQTDSKGVKTALKFVRKDTKPVAK